MRSSLERPNKNGALFRKNDTFSEEPVANAPRRYVQDEAQSNVSSNDIIPESQKNTTKNSLSIDSDGNSVNENMQLYMKDTKIVDENGRLKVMYHGSPESFTKFDRKKAKSSGLNDLTKMVHCSG